MAKSNVAKQMVLNFLARNQTVTQPTQLYLALYSTNPTDADTGTELSYSGYARQPVIFSAPEISGGRATIRNSGIIKFSIDPTASGTISYAGLKTALTGGNLVYYAALSETYNLNQGTEPVVPVRGLSVSES